VPDNVFELFLPTTLRIAGVTAARIAGRSGMPADARRDLEQEALLELWRKAPLFNAHRASWPTFSDRVMVNRLRSLMRSHQAASRERGTEQPFEEFRHSNPAPDLWIELRIDVKRVLCGVSRFDRAVAISLAEYSITETSHRLDVPRATVYRSIERLRVTFNAAGFVGRPGRPYAGCRPSGNACLETRQQEVTA